MENQMVYVFRGDNKLLKTIGFVFEKVGMAKQKSYRRGDISMLLRTGMVIDIGLVTAAQQVAIINFILNNLDKSDEFWSLNQVCTRANNVYDMDTYWKLKMEKYMPLRDTFNAVPPGLSNAAELAAMQASEFRLDPYVIHIELVNTIKDLHRLGICKVEQT